ncbi:MAG TPA: Hsp70 family protein [Kofleriaceae bacterium]|nr:Hsp70 family protein [Kofleriaceae bacterium]
MSDPIVGIDLGTSNTVVAHASDPGNVQILADANGYKIHPSVVSFHPTGGVVVGAAAKQRKVIDPKNTIYSVKRLIGRTFDSKEVQTAKQRSPFQIKDGANQLPIIVTRGGEFAVPEISAIVLDHAKNVATHALGTPVSRAVVTVPASFNDAQRSGTATAGSIAGLTVVRVLNEPTAAALAYGNLRSLRETIAVYDFGGGTFDITILKLSDQVYEVLGTAGDTFLGGDDLDERLVDRMVEKFLMENRVDLRQNEVSMMRLRAVAEQVKIELSRRNRAMVRIDEIAYGPKGKALDLQIEIKRDEFVRQVADIIDRTFPVCEEALKLANLSIDFIDDVILVGGTTKIPYVRDQVAKFFSKAPRTDVNPEEAVAAGAALQANALDRVLSGRKPSRQIPVQSFEGETFGGETANKTVTYPEAPAGQSFIEMAMAQAAPDEDLLEPTGERPPGPRKTQAYAQVEMPRPGRPGERAATRGDHHDVFEDRTPPPVSPTQPVLGRMTKQNITPPPAAKGGPPVKPPPTPPPRTATQPVPVVRRPPTQQPLPKTITIPPSKSGPVMVPPVPPGPASTLRGIAPVHEEDEDTTGFPNLTTEKSITDLDLETSPASTAKGFAPHVPVATPQAKTIVVEPPLAAPLPSAPQAVPVMAPPSPIVIDVTPRGLGIGTVAGFCEELIRRNSRVPTEIRKLFTTSRDSQDSVRIIVCQGESRRLDNNTVIADLRLENLPRRPRGETSIEVTFALDANGILQVRARDAQTGAEQRASLDIVGTIQQGDVDAAREKLQALRR